ncbi:uncharacterized protein BKA55DRAFT_692144 [Fusarium redolens]|uniref:Uncharacterized protein n=1 Tax=Fusarium redolens TaxID=48865 RepID=A0A9P9GT93_FUSRE|nr:uncharacterized protein BKA55DRAFT_692144 [Fusarium redolens]KAH7244337.1 hypothetical protein BKA55DRAFT_692144 [Fusarium redolens]
MAFNPGFFTPALLRAVLCNRPVTSSLSVRRWNTLLHGPKTPHEYRPGDHYAPLPSVVGPMLPSPNLASSIYAPQAGADTSLPFRAVLRPFE